MMATTLDQPSAAPGDGCITITLPDMFLSFASQPPVLNAHEESVKLESESWLNQACSLSPETSRKVSACSFSYFCAVAAPDAPPDRFRILCDWGNWVFIYDDMFDDGELRNQPVLAQRVMESFLAPMLGRPVPEHRPLVLRAHDDIFERLQKTIRAGPRQRYVRATQDYCEGALAHVQDQLAGHSPSLEDLVAKRRRSASASPLYHLVAWAHDLDVPDEAFDHPAIRELEELGADMVSITNDLVSYLKEKGEGVPHNMVIACEQRGLSTQQAVDTVGRFLEARYSRWDAVEALVPRWDDPAADAQVRRYIDGIKDVVKANLYWSFHTKRYFGRDGDRVRHTRCIDVPVGLVCKAGDTTPDE